MRTYVDQEAPAADCRCGSRIPAVLMARTEHHTGKGEIAILDGPAFHLDGRRVCAECFWGTWAKRTLVGANQVGHDLVPGQYVKHPSLGRGRVVGPAPDGRTWVEFTDTDQSLRARVSVVDLEPLAWLDDRFSFWFMPPEGAHARVRVRAGGNPGSRGYAGELTMGSDDAAILKSVLKLIGAHIVEGEDGW